MCTYIYIYVHILIQDHSCSCCKLWACTDSRIMMYHSCARTTAQKNIVNLMARHAIQRIAAVRQAGLHNLPEKKTISADFDTIRWGPFTIPYCHLNMVHPFEGLFVLKVFTFARVPPPTTYGTASSLQARGRLMPPKCWAGQATGLRRPFGTIWAH